MSSHVKAILWLFLTTPYAQICLAQPASEGLPLVQWTGQRSPLWQQVRALQDQQKYQQALQVLEQILQQARRDKDSQQQTQATIEIVRLQTSLHAYETAVKWFMDQPLPADLLGRTALQLYYAGLLRNYLSMYFSEIRQRQPILSQDQVDLKAMTKEQIMAAASTACLEAFRYRSQLGSQPTKVFSDYVDILGYPTNIMPTLRDVVSYYWVDLLADRQGWTANQTNEVYTIDLVSLLEPAGPLHQDTQLSDPNIHPIKRIAAILADLEYWHLNVARTEAALEARLALLRRLWGSYTIGQDRDLLKAHLQQRLESARGLPWWAVGMAQLAQWVREEDDQDALVRARKIALEGMQRFRNSVGGQQCRHIVESIEQPEYSIEAMASDGPDRPSILVRHRNIKTIYFRAYRLDLEETIRSADDYALLADRRTIDQLLKQRPTTTWQSDLPDTPDYRTRSTFLRPPLHEPGLYVVIASARQAFSESENHMTAVAMIITDLVLVTRNQPGLLEAIVLSGTTGRPIAGTEVTLYRYDWRNGHRPVATVKTSEDGIARFEQADWASHFLFARKGRFAALDPSYLYPRARPTGRSTWTLIYTDRSIYRPGQIILFKTVVCTDTDGPLTADHHVMPRTNVVVRLLDANRQEVAKAELVTNDQGTASGSLQIPTGRMLGRWSLEASPPGEAQIQVEEYKRPTFELTILDPNAPLRLNRPVVIEGQARYYFGMPVTSGKAQWRVERTAILPWWCWRPGAGWTETQLVAAGGCGISADGSFQIQFTPKADERLGEDPELYYNYRLTVELTDEGGETRSISRDFRLGFTAVQVRISGSKGLFVEGEPIQVTVGRTSLDGVGMPGEGTWKLIRLEQPSQTLLPAEQPSGQPTRSLWETPRTRWNHAYDPKAAMRLWKDGKELASGSLTHDKTGKAELKLGSLPAGAYRLRYTTEDPYGQRCQTSYEFVCAGNYMELALPAILVVDSQTAKVGQTVKVLVHSGFGDQVLILETHKEGKVIDRQFLEASRPNSVIDIPITEADRGGFTLVLLAVRDHQVMELTQPVNVPWDNRMLKVAFSRFRDLLRPGQTETWTIRVTGPGDVNIPVFGAEVLAYMYDRSLDLFIPHRPPDPLSLFADRRWRAQATSSIRAADRIWVRSSGFRPPSPYPVLSGPSVVLPFGYGIGGPGMRRAGSRRLVVREPWPTRMVAQAVTESRDDALLSKSLSTAAPPTETEQAAPEVQLRTDFSETALFQPHLLTGPDGCVEIVFQVPQSLTSWSVWAHAITKDLCSGSANQQARTVKDLMVRPYLPRFLREGDQAHLQVVINNAGDVDLSGRLDFDIVDPVTEQSLLREFGLQPHQASASFSAPGGGSTSVCFVVKTPARVGLVAVKAVARSGILSDGELRPIPILPGRMHLMQSRFVALRDRQTRTMTFEDMSSDDPTRIDEQLVVTVDAQLFYSVLAAMPYLLEYPYECTEQVFNRYLASGILSSMYDHYPTIAQMAKQLSIRDTPLERFDQPDANRKMALEETPWLRQAMGQTKEQVGWLNILKPEVAKEQRDTALAKLQQAQTSSGGFPWFAGGPPSPYITLYILHGFSRALEFGVQIPRQIVERAWQYMHRYYIDELVKNCIDADRGWEMVTFLNYILSSYPDQDWTKVFTKADRARMLEFSFRHWREHSPMLKGYLALTLHRAGRKDDAILVWQSVMDSAKTEQDLGTFWAPEDRAWLWYNDTIESHAFAIRTLLELAPKDQRLQGLVIWLLLNKKLNHWKSTKATSEAVYSLARYMADNELLGVREAATVRIGQIVHEFVFEPNAYTGKSNQLVLQGTQIDPVASSAIQIDKSTPGLMFASATWHFSTERMPQSGSGDLLSVERTFFKVERTNKGTVLIPLAEGARVEIGDLIEVHISLRSKHPVGYVHLRDPRPAGCEPVSLRSGHRWNLGICWYEEVRDSGMNFFFEQLPQGEYPFVHRLRAATAGVFKVAPATVQPMYAPEFAAYSSGATIAIASSAK